ncbi:MAG: hypothetical protein M3R40_05080, partial [Pseudomonadota bacterium]|nr:hypothetical protein [Pseudomonadota bacterium]
RVRSGLSHPRTRVPRISASSLRFSAVCRRRRIAALILAGIRDPAVDSGIADSGIAFADSADFTV